MADAVTTDILQDGHRNLVMKFTNVSDGTGETAVAKVDVSTLVNTPTSVRIDQIYFTTSGMAVDILWDATANVLAMTLPTDGADHFDFREFSGIQNNAGAGVTGDILFTTRGATLGDAYTIILYMVKQPIPR